MKPTIIITVILSAILVMSSLAWAKGTPGVSNTVHNLASTNPLMHSYTADNVDQVCVFCHTPHGGSLTGPLWNHDLPANTFTHYNSALLSNYMQNSLSPARPVNDESLLCMSCHDGSVAVDHLVNDPNSLNGAQLTIFFGNTDVEIVSGFGAATARIGENLSAPGGSGDLSDDHPISFSYSQVLTSVEYLPGGTKENELRSVPEVLAYNGEGIRLFAPDNRVECSSCHDPHVNYEGSLGGNEAYRPFLIRPNSGSELCLACHNK